MHFFSRFLSVRRSRGGTHSSLRAIFGIVATAGILSLAAACDKRGEVVAKGAAQTSLAGKPSVLFLLFGDKSDPRLLPVATFAAGRVKPIVLDAPGWHTFDSTYFTAGAHFPLFERGVSMGDAVVRRGMWDGRDALYKLPGCTALRPLAAVTLTGKPVAAVMLELLATSDTLAVHKAKGALVKADSDSAAAALVRIGQHEGLTVSARGELDEQTMALATGATTHPTLIGSYMERGSGVNGKPRHLFEISDYSDSSHSYVRSFVHVPADSVREFRRLIDHVDLTGDGTDEIVLEAWKIGSDSFLVIMKFANGQWREVARSATSWCADMK